METRKATAAEILEAKASAIKWGRTVSFRHFVREIFNPRAENGVSHRQRNSSKIRVIDGKPHVMHHGGLEEITGDFITLESGTTFVADIRLNSEYLP